MRSQLHHYPTVKSTFQFAQIVLKKKITDKVNAGGRINAFNTTRPIGCQENQSCAVSPQQILRLNDINGTKGFPSLQEIFDLRPCYFSCFTNLWTFTECFEIIKTSNVLTSTGDMVFHDMSKYGKWKNLMEGDQLIIGFVTVIGYRLKVRKGSLQKVLNIMVNAADLEPRCNSFYKAIEMIHDVLNGMRRTPERTICKLGMVIENLIMGVDYGYRMNTPRFVGHICHRFTIIRIFCFTYC